MLDTTNPNNYEYKTEHLEIHILGGIKTTKLETLRITLSVQKPRSYNVLRHGIDLYNDNQVEKLVRKIAERLEIGTSVTRRTLQELTKALENHRFLLLEQQQVAAPNKEMTTTELRTAEAFLKKKDLLERTNGLIGKSGVIGEHTNRLLMYLIFTSRKTGNPLHCISLGSSGVGKTHLQSKVAELIPEEDKVEITYRPMPFTTSIAPNYNINSFSSRTWTGRNPCFTHCGNFNRKSASRKRWSTRMPRARLDYIELLKDTIADYGAPEIHNSDQGSQYTSAQYIEVLEKHEIQISMDGKGRALDNIYIERFWKSIKYEKIYLNPPNGGLDLYKMVNKYIEFYNTKRRHTEIGKVPPDQVYAAKKIAS